MNEDIPLPVDLPAAALSAGSMLGGDRESRAGDGLALAQIEDRCQRMVAQLAQLLPEFLKLHAASGGLSEFFETTSSLAGYFPKPTAVDPLRSFAPAWCVNSDNPQWFCPPVVPPRGYSSLLRSSRASRSAHFY
jgi:hypothetical protein